MQHHTLFSSRFFLFVKQVKTLLDILFRCLCSCWPCYLRPVAWLLRRPSSHALVLVTQLPDLRQEGDEGGVRRRRRRLVVAGHVPALASRRRDAPLPRRCRQLGGEEEEPQGQPSREDVPAARGRRR